MDERKLVRYRRGEGGRLAGVCAGVAAYFGWNPTVVRIGFVLFGLFGAGEIVYAVLWLLMPRAPR